MSQDYSSPQLEERAGAGFPKNEVSVTSAACVCAPHPSLSRLSCLPVVVSDRVAGDRDCGGLSHNDALPSYVVAYFPTAHSHSLRVRFFVQASEQGLASSSQHSFAIESLSSQRHDTGMSSLSCALTEMRPEN